MKYIIVFLAALIYVEAFYVFEKKSINDIGDKSREFLKSFEIENRIEGIDCPSFEENRPATLFPHPSDCTLYYECSWGLPVQMECPPGLHFNPKLNTCDWPFQAGCAVSS